MRNQKDSIFNSPEVIITPRGSYILYSGNEDITPTIKEYLEAKAQEHRIKAANHIVIQDSPNVPVIPSRSIPSVLAGIFGMSDSERISTYGTQKSPLTCIFTATNQYNDPNAVVAGNKTFFKDPQRYGFERIELKDAKPGDIIQFISDSPHHATIMTGIGKDGKPTVSYSNGYHLPYRVQNGDTIFTMVKDNGLKAVKEQLGRAVAYRYIGTVEKQQEWLKEYERLFSQKPNINVSFPKSDQQVPDALKVEKPTIPFFSNPQAEVSAAFERLMQEQDDNEIQRGYGLR